MGSNPATPTIITFVDLEGSPIHPAPLRIVPAPSLEPATSADHAPAGTDKRVASKTPSKKRQS